MTDLSKEPIETPSTSAGRLARIKALAKERASLLIKPGRRGLLNETEGERHVRMMQSDDPSIWEKMGGDS